jgi:TolB-like protein/tetratricopeptide (TPR) repeat protein
MRLVLPGTRPPSNLAVLPFANLTVDQEFDHFAGAFTFELAGTLRRLPGVRIAARASSAAFAGRGRELDVIAGALGVGTVLDGRARRSRKQLTVDAELLSTESGTQLWAAHFTRPAGDVVAVQAEIAHGIARELCVPHTHPAPKHVPSADAYDLYLRGRSDPGSGRVALERNLEYFERAVAIDPGLGTAYAALASTAVNLGALGHLPFPGLAPRIRSAAARALDLDDGVAEARQALAILVFLADWDLEAAASELDRAIAADPYDAEAQRWRAWLMVAQDRAGEAVEAANRLVVLDPLSSSALATLALVHAWLRHGQAAVDAGERAIAVAPASFMAHRALAVGHLITGNLSAARPELDQAVLLSRRHPWCLSELAVVCAMLGDRQTAETLHGELVRRSPHEYVQRVLLAQTSAALGRLEDAFKLLDQAARLREPLPLFRLSPYLDSVRDHPRFSRVTR